MSHHHIITITLATLAIAAPTAVAKPIGTDGDIRTSSLAGTRSAPAQDLRNPDNRTVEGARASERYYRSYDTTSELAPGLTPSTTGRSRQDLRSADARDAAAGRGTFNAPDVTVVKLPSSTPVASDGGTDWGDLGIGAGGALSLALLALGVTFAIAHRRQRARRTAPTG